MSNSGDQSDTPEESEEGLSRNEEDRPLWREQRRHRRVSLDISIRFLMPDRSEHVGHVLDISGSGIAIGSDVKASSGDNLIIYVDEVGRFEGKVKRVFDGGFAVEFRTSWIKIERTVEQLTWHLNKQHFDDLTNDRQFPRETMTKNAILRRADGTLIACKVTDMSVGGFAIEIAERPPIGEIIEIGKMEGRVVRHEGSGVAIELIDVKERKRGLADSLF